MPSDAEFEELRQQVATLQSRVVSLTAEFDGHVGDAFGAGAGNQYVSHPRQVVEIAEFGGGVSRLDRTGIQLRNESTYGGDVPTNHAIFWVPDFVEDPPTYVGDLAFIEGGADGTDVDIVVVAKNGSSDTILYVINDDSGRRAVRVNPILEFSDESADPSSPVDGSMWYRSDTDKHRVRQNGATENLATEAYADGAGGMSLVVKGADETVNSSTTLQNDDELLFAVAANTSYQFEGTLFVSSSSTPDFKMEFTGPSGAIGFWATQAWGDGAATAAAGQQVGALGGSGQSIALSTWPVVVRFWGGIAVSSTAGNLTLQWAQDTSDAGNTTVEAGSYIKHQTES